MDKIIERLSALFDPDHMSEYFVGKLLPDLVVAIITFVAFWVLWKVISRTMGLVLARSRFDTTAQRFVQAVTRYVIMTIGTVTALSQLGINTGSILASLGVVGLTIGFAAKDALSNIISGLFIFWDRPFVIDDLVEIGGQYGRVQEITMRSTRVVTVDGKMLAIPNSTVLNSTVASYTNFPNLRIDVDVTVGTGEDLGRVRRALLALVAADDRYLAEPAPVVVVTALNDYNVAVQVRAWLKDERTHMASRFDLRERSFEALRAAGVDMPLETLQIAPLTISGGVSPVAKAG